MKKINTTINEEDISWTLDGQKIIHKGDFVDAEYYSDIDAVIAFKCGRKEFFLIDTDGNLISQKEVIINSEECKIYTSLDISSRENSTFRVVIGHSPEYQGETFWQHDIDLDTGVLSEPICRWR